MATRFCMSCGGEFIASVETCPDCGIDLVDERPEDHLDPSLTAEGEVAYELHEWAVESRAMLQQLLTAEGVPHAWQGTELLVPAALEARTDALVEQVEVTTLPTLDPDAPKLAYDIDDWSDEQQTDLMAALEQSGISYEFDQDGALVVEEDDEARVEAILDAIEFPDALPVDDDDEDEDGEDGDDEDEDESGDVLDADGLPEAADVLSDLFVAADRLKKSATDADGVLGIVDAATLAPDLPLPYGFARPLWDDIVAQAVGLKELLEDNTSTDEQIEERAAVLRDTLRPLV